MTTGKDKIIFRQSDLADVLATDGYGVVSFLGGKEIEQLHELFHTHVKEEEIGIKFDSLTEPTVLVRKALHDGIMDICAPHISRLFDNYRVVISMYYVKKSDCGSELGLHLDPSMTIDPYDHFGIWVPLIDADSLGGEFCILPRSKSYTHPYHALTIPSPYSQIGDLTKAHMDTLSVKAGDAVVFYNNMPHYSRPNISGRTRLALVIKLITSNAPLITAFGQQRDNDTHIQLVQVPDDYYLSETFVKSGRPEGRVLNNIKVSHRLLSSHDLLSLVTDG